MPSTQNVIVVYAIYSLVALAVTGLLARTLFQNGAVFLHDVFEDRPGLAEAVNRLLVVGFYMLNLGYAFYVMRTDESLDAFGAVQFLVNRLALLLGTLALLHFVNVFVFWRIRARREQRQLPPPVAPQILIPPPPPPVPTSPAQ
ncbi:MAG: hypothetical protein ABR518_03310 [Actinomycetota bacterium]